MAKVVLDIVADIIKNEAGEVIDLELGDETRFSENTHGVSFSVLIENGPGGGWPEIEISGTREQVESWVRAVYLPGCDADTVQEILGYIED